ncbi:glycosyltransferase family 2 protein [Lysinibacillus parviboronicapiens]
MTNYNYEKYIVEAIESVMNQTYKHFELIIVDDGSTDQSREFIQHYQSQYPNEIKLIFQENGGQGSAFNAGFEAATGEIIAFLDADDYWYENKLEKIVEYHKNHAGIQHNLLINNQWKFALLEDQVAKQKKGLELYGFLGTIPTSGLSFKKEYLKEIFPIPEKEYKICADLYVKVMFLNNHEIFSIDSPLGCYRSHGKNHWFTSQASSLEYNKITLDKLNEEREKQGRATVQRNSEAEAIGYFMLDSMEFEGNKRYVLYGMGELAKVFYTELKSYIDIVCFSGSFVKNERENYLGLPVKSLEYLINNSDEYDKIIISSSQVSEILQYLQENGIYEEEILAPKL